VAALVGVLAFSATALLAQDEPALTPSEAQLFDRNVVREDVRVVAADGTPSGAEVPRGLTVRNLLGAPGAALLLGGELDRKGESMLVQPPDLRDLSLVLAADRRKVRRGRQEYVVRAGSQYPAHALRAVFDRAEGSSQSITAQLEPAAPGAAHQRSWRGTLRVVRVLDPEGRRLASFRASYDLRVELTAHEKTTHGIDFLQVQVDEDWTHREILDGEGPEFRSRVHKAIQAGGEYVAEQLENPSAGSFAPEEPNSHGAGSGHLALAILTALKAGVDPASEVMTKALDELRGRNMTNTYCLATALMALEAYYAPSGEREALLAGQLDEPMERRPSATDLELMQKWTERLLGNIDTTQDPAYVRRFHYHPNTSWDNSNSQYAMLGLYAAQLCGVELSPQVWYAATRHFLDCQRDEQLRPIMLQLKTHRELGNKSDRRRTTRTVAGSRRTTPAGWAYHGSGAATGSMTTAGITGLVIGSAALRHQKKLGRKLHAEIELAMQAGFAWFAEHLTVRTNPTTDHGSAGWHYYYLYGLERACELNQVARIQDRDWYFEGAAYLLEDHFSRKSLGGLTDTCFAVLFLKKAALPAITGR